MVRRIRFIYRKSILGFRKKFRFFRYCIGGVQKVPEGHQWGPHFWEACMGPRGSALAHMGQEQQPSKAQPASPPRDKDQPQKIGGSWGDKDQPSPLRRQPWIGIGGPWLHLLLLYKGGEMQGAGHFSPWRLPPLSSFSSAPKTAQRSSAEITP